MVVSVPKPVAAVSYKKEHSLSIPVRKLLEGLTTEKIMGDTELGINSVCYDSRLVRAGDVFVAIRGFQTDGHQFISQALEQGAAVIVAEKDGNYHPALKILVKDSRLALAQLAVQFYGDPSSNLKIIGVTGTNGKTTITYWLKSILEGAGKRTGLTGTVRYFIGNEAYSASRTTPESLDLQAFLYQMVQKEVGFVAMEVSSHALELKRVHGIGFSLAIFTNLTREHLDFHKTMENYRKAKGILFENLGPDKTAILNLDDSTSQYYAQLTKAKKIFYSLIDRKAEFFAKKYKFSPAGTEATFATPAGIQDFDLKLTGEFNLSNFAAVLAAAQLLGLNYEQVKKGAENFTGAPGRMERIDLGQDFNIWIDYAHTPDGMQRLLETVRSFTTGRLICLFGCGGDRDRGKRPQMGRIASTYANLVILSSDNPRSEDPAKIIADIQEGIPDKKKVKVVLDRKEALEYAVNVARDKDSVIVTGKGHEDYQEAQGIKYPFHEREIIEAELQRLGYNQK